MHDIETFEKKYGRIRVVVDMNKDLLQLHIGTEKSAIYYVGNYNHVHQTIPMRKGKECLVEVWGTTDSVSVRICGTDDIITLDVEHDNINYVHSLEKKFIDDVLAKVTLYKEQLAQSIVTYFNRVNVVFHLPCIIENPVDTMAGGIAIKEVRNGRAVIDEEETVHSSYELADLDDDTIIRLYDWVGVDDKITPR